VEVLPLHPELAETCNGTDDDGDGETDEGFADDDADGEANCIDTSCEITLPAAGGFAALAYLLLSRFS